MVLGMSLATFTLLHALLSLAGIGSGLIVVYGLLTGKPLNGSTAIFLVTTILTSVTGFLFPVERLLPSHVIGIISLVVLAVALLARYPLHMAGAWRWIYVVCAVLALYLNCFVLVVQSFLKASAFRHSWLLNLLSWSIFMVLGIFAVKKFRVSATA